MRHTRHGFLLQCHGQVRAPVPSNRVASRRRHGTEFEPVAHALTADPHHYHRRRPAEEGALIPTAPIFACRNTAKSRDSPNSERLCYRPLPQLTHEEIASFDESTNKIQIILLLFSRNISRHSDQRDKQRKIYNFEEKQFLKVYKFVKERGQIFWV